MIDVNQEQVERTAQRCRERDIIVPTFAQQKDPGLIPGKIRKELEGIDPSAVHPRNLFRITWKNDPRTGSFGAVNYLEIPSELSGVPARILGLVGGHFPTGSHKVGATFGCLVPRLVTGTFDPTSQKAVWPSTGNYCRGGAFNAALLGCRSVAILPEEMSRERFEWLQAIGSEVIATPGCESNVKEIYDKCWELRASRDDVVVLNQFDEFGNGMWHYEVTAAAIREVLAGIIGPADDFFGYVSATGSAGTIAAGEGLKRWYPACKVVAAEARQCPTLLRCGFGAHRIEGIGDKHVPWIHNVRATDLVVAVDDAAPMALIRLFNEPAGKAFLAGQGLGEELISGLGLLGISSIANLLACSSTARWFDLDGQDILFTVFTDSMEMYRSRLAEARTERGPYTREQAELDFHLHLQGPGSTELLELDQRERRRIHNLKYFTWIEQQQKDVAELNDQWYRYKTYWPERFGRAAEYDRLIADFNRRVGLNRGNDSVS